MGIKLNKNKTSPLYRTLIYVSGSVCDVISLLPDHICFWFFLRCDGRVHRLWPFCPRTWQWVRSGNDWDSHAIWSELISYSSNHSWPLLAFGWRNYHSGHNQCNPEGNLNHSICGIISCCFCASSCKGLHRTQAWRASPPAQVFSCFVSVTVHVAACTCTAGNAQSTSALLWMPLTRMYFVLVEIIYSEFHVYVLLMICLERVVSFLFSPSSFLGGKMFWLWRTKPTEEFFKACVNIWKKKRAYSGS